MAEKYVFTGVKVDGLHDRWTLPEGYPALNAGGPNMSQSYSSCQTLVRCEWSKIWFCTNASHDSIRLVTDFVNRLWDRRFVRTSSFVHKPDGNEVCSATMGGDYYFAPEWVFDLRNKVQNNADLMRMVLGMIEKPATSQTNKVQAKPGLSAEAEICAYLRTGQKEPQVPQQITTAHVKEDPVPSNVVPALGNIEGTLVQPDSPHPSITARIVGGNSDMAAICSDRASQAIPRYIGGGPLNVISGPGGAIFADGRNAVIGGGNSGIISTVAVPSKLCSTDVGPTARLSNDTEGHLREIPPHALVVSGSTDVRLTEGSYVLRCSEGHPVLLLRSRLGDVIIHQGSRSNVSELSRVLAECMMFPVYAADWLDAQGLQQRLCIRSGGVGEWLMQATPSTWARIKDFDERHGRSELVRALMTERTFIRMEEEMTHMAFTKNVEEAVPHVEVTTTPAVVGKPKRSAKERAKAAAKKAGKDALDDAKEALFRGTVRNTVKEVHGTAITIAKGVTDNDTALMLVALMETERGKAALAAGFGAVLGFMIDMLEGEHPALERVARELKVENGSVLMDPVIGAVLAPLAQLFAKVCLMAGDKSAADQVHKLTAPLQLVAAGGTLLGEEVRVAEKAAKLWRNSRRSSLSEPSSSASRKRHSRRRRPTGFTTPHPTSASDARSSTRR